MFINTKQIKFIISDIGWRCAQQFLPETCRFDLPDLFFRHFALPVMEIFH